MSKVSQVMAWPLDDLASAATVYDADSELVAGAADSLGRSLAADPFWRGTTKNAAVARISSETARLRAMESALQQAATAARAGHGSLTSVRDRLRQQIETAATGGFNVADNGAVAHPDPYRRADSDFLTERIQALLAQAQTADSSVAADIARSAALLDGSGLLLPDPGGGFSGIDLVLEKLSGMDAHDVATYWGALTQAQRDRLIAVDPYSIGNTDGIPFADRSRANTVAIREALVEEVAKRSSGDADERRIERLTEMLQPVDDPDRPGATIPRQIIGFDSSGSGRYIEMVGELTADSPGVGVLVPGTGTDLGNADASRRRALGLSRRSGAPIIVYVDGDLPPDLAHAAKTSYAEDLAPRLVEFGKALDAEIRGSGLHTPTTYVGHSYGGAVLGTAEQQGLRADRIVHASSAGTGVELGPWKNPNAEVKRYSMTPPGDFIHYVQHDVSPLGYDPDHMPGVVRLDSGHHSGPGHELVTDHSKYLDDPDSDAIGNIADVIAGRTPKPYVERAPDIDAEADIKNHAVPWLRDKLLDLLPTG